MKIGTMSRWLDVEVGTAEVNLNTLPSNINLVDLIEDNENLLFVGDLGRAAEEPNLRMYKGAMLMTSHTLPDLPLGVVSVYTSESGTPPLIVVGLNTCVYVYREMMLYYKYYLQCMEPNRCEIEAWKQLLDPFNHNPDAITTITDNLRSIPPQILTMESRAFLNLTLEEQFDYLQMSPELPNNKLREIACIGTLKFNSAEKRAAECLIVGSEDGNVVIVEVQTFKELCQANLCSIKKTPFQIISTGLYNVDYRLTIATREKSVCLLKRDWTEGKILFNTEDHIISIEVMVNDNSVMVICADNTLACYNKKGKKHWSINLEHRPVAMTLVPVLRLGVTLTAVALASGHVHLYSGKAQVDTVFVRDVVSVMKFGQLGQEEHVLTIVTASGNLMLKILKRTADFNTHAAGVETSHGAAAGQKPWLIPKKSKLFIEQTVRERDNAINMHHVFQYSLSGLRLSAARALRDAHASSDNSVGAGDMEALRLTAEVEGLGPLFRVTLIISNTSLDRAALGLALLFHVHTLHYKVSNPYIKVPLLPPNGKLQFPTKIEEVFEDNINPDVFFRPVTGHAGERALVKVLLVREGARRPVLAATLQMPPTDPMMLPFDKLQANAQDNAWDKEMA